MRKYRRLKKGDFVNILGDEYRGSNAKLFPKKWKKNAIGHHVGDYFGFIYRRPLSPAPKRVKVDRPKSCRGCDRGRIGVLLDPAWLVVDIKVSARIGTGRSPAQGGGNDFCYWFDSWNVAWGNNDSVGIL